MVIQRKTLKKRRIINLFLFVLLLITTSCSSPTHDLLEGVWAIEEVRFNGEDISEMILGNMIYFEYDGVAGFPLLNNDIDKDNIEGSWELDNGDYLIINSRNHYFDGTFKLCFHKNIDSNSIELIIASNELHVKAVKFLTSAEEIFELPHPCR